MAELQIRRRAEDLVSAAEAAALRALLAEAFGPPFDRRTYYKQLPSFRLLAWRAEALVGQVAICHRMVALGEVPRRIFGVVDLCVAGAARGGGIARRLLAAAEAEARAAGADDLLLFAGAPALYARLGFARHGNPCRWLAIDEHRSLRLREGPPPGLLMTLTLGSLAWKGEAELDLLGHLF